MVNHETFNVRAVDDLPHRDIIEAEDELWENNGWLFRGSDGDHEFMVWSALYWFKGAPGGQFAVDEVCFPQTIFIEGEYPEADRTVMHDNDFLIAGTHFSEYLTPHEVSTSSGEEETRWAIADREHVSRPPTWAVVGEQAGVELELEYEATGPAYWVDQTLKQIDGYQATARGSGTIRLDDAVYHPEGYGQHEKFYFINPNKMQDVYGRGDWIGGDWWRWHVGFQDDVQVFVTIYPESEKAIGRVIVNGETYNFDYEQITFHDIAYWNDPRSGITIPVEWHINMRSEDAIIDYTANAYARAYYLWDYLNEGIQVLYWQIASGKGVFQTADGEVRDLDLSYMGHTRRPWLRFGKNDRRKQGGLGTSVSG